MTGLIMAPGSKLFSPFEKQVLKGLLEGRHYRQIAEDLGRAPKAVDNAIQRIRKKLGAFFSD